MYSSSSGRYWPFFGAVNVTITAVGSYTFTLMKVPSLPTTTEHFGSGLPEMLRKIRRHSTSTFATWLAFVTNVPGPRHPLAVAGAPLERVWPVTPIQGNVRLGVSALSYGGGLHVAVHADADAVAADVVGEALDAELRRIAALG